MGEGEYGTDQLDEVVHPTLGKLKFPREMPTDERNALIQQQINKPGFGQGEISNQPSGPLHWFDQLKGDIKYGTGATFPGRVMKKLGAPGTATGGQPLPITAGAIEGVPEMIHGAGTAISSPGQRVRGLNEAIEGGFKTLGSVAPFMSEGSMLPKIVPSIASYGAIDQGTRKTAETLGANPEESELAGNIATIAAPGFKRVMPPTGKFIESNAAPIGRTAAIGTGVYEAAHTGNPWWLLAALPRITRTATEGVRGAGKLINWAGETPTMPHEFDMAPGAYKPGFHGPEIRGLLPRGPITPEPPVENEPPITRPAASIVTRGKGGKMTKQFTTGEAEPGAKSIPPGKVEPAWQPPQGEPKAPPQVKNGKLIHGPEEVESDMEQDRRGAPVERPQPLTNESESPIIKQEEKPMEPKIVDSPDWVFKDNEANKQTVSQYEEAIKKGEPISHPIAERNNKGELELQDGHHRVRAYRNLGYADKDIPIAEVKNGVSTDKPAKDAKTPEEAIIRDLQKQFPQKRISVKFNDEETISLSIDGKKYRMEISSDDPHFDFKPVGKDSKTRLPITLPYPNDWSRIVEGEK